MNDEMRTVLRHLADHFSSPDVRRLDTPFDVPGLDFDSEVRAALRRLATASPPFVTGVDVAQRDYPVVITGLTERGWETVEADGDPMKAEPGIRGRRYGEGDELYPLEMSSPSSSMDREILEAIAHLEGEGPAGRSVSVEEVAAAAAIDHDEAIRIVTALMEAGQLRGKTLRGDDRTMSINGIALLPRGRSALRRSAAEPYGRYSRVPDRSMMRSVFIVHGHDNSTKVDVARTVHLLTGENPIILHEKPNQGRTLIEKFEGHAAEAGFVVVLATADDVGRTKSADEDRPRARQNVVFEWGFFVGALGRDKVAVVYEEGVELPSDILGVAYIPLGTGDQWKHDLAREMRTAGIDADSNRL